MDEIGRIGQTRIGCPCSWESPKYGYVTNVAGIIAESMIAAGCVGASNVPTKFVDARQMSDAYNDAGAERAMPHLVAMMRDYAMETGAPMPPSGDEVADDQ